MHHLAESSKSHNKAPIVSVSAQLTIDGMNYSRLYCYAFATESGTRKNTQKRAKDKLSSIQDELSLMNYTSYTCTVLRQVVQFDHLYRLTASIEVLPVC